ncbi:hypothetical protein X777_14407 [Ooceraea biroi]|uniref:Uncharacterized protein n=1 Tax=Ooceraea biroi TaxID=2015173 RepID=A0A026VWL0_OOCBI|nr:hypothetical protein X777_14407 [Ooceraea biroi]
MLRVHSQNSVYEQEAKFVQDRITGVEKHFAELCTIFAAFTRKAARLRDGRFLYNFIAQECTGRRQLDKVRERNPRNRQMVVSLQLKPHFTSIT